jgi:hypothetical protein
MAVFRDLIREMAMKYKMLWFVVDTHHGQRYFFICGCKRTVTKDRRESSDSRIWGLCKAGRAGIRGSESHPAKELQRTAARRMLEAPEGRSKAMQHEAFF